MHDRTRGRFIPDLAMTRDEYIQKVNAVLNEHTAQAAQRLGAALACIPAKTQKVEIVIFVDQDGEGCLDVRVTLTGPDLSVLNRAIAGHAELFGTRMTQTGFDPALPVMPARYKSFSVHDTLTDCAASWLPAVWSMTDRAGVNLPIIVVSHDGDGTIAPFDLTDEPNAT
jgi:hypothetical protein